VHGDFTNENIKRNENKKFLTRLGSEWGGLHLDIELIPDKSLIISAGLSYDISFDEELIKRKQCYIIGIDPTYLTARTVFKYYCKNFSRRKNFKLIRKAVHGKTGLTIYMGGPARTFLSPQGEKAITISLDDIVSMYAGASVLKLDIEGAEFPAIESLSTKLRTPQVAISFHIWLNSESDQFPNEGVCPLLYTSEDVLNAVRKIKGMGYKLVYEEREHKERIGQEALFIRKEFALKYKDIELVD
jgi:hypothetical protein